MFGVAAQFSFLLKVTILTVEENIQNKQYIEIDQSRVVKNSETCRTMNRFHSFSTKDAIRLNKTN